MARRGLTGQHLWWQAGGAPMAQQQGMSGFGGAPDDIGNDGLTNLQRQVLGVFEQPAHLAASDGLTVEQVRATALHGG